MTIFLLLAGKKNHLRAGGPSAYLNAGASGCLEKMQGKCLRGTRAGVYNPSADPSERLGWEPFAVVDTCPAENAGVADGES